MSTTKPFELLTHPVPAAEIARTLDAGADPLVRYLGEEIYSNTDAVYLTAVRTRLANTARLHASTYGDTPAVLLRAPGRLNAFLEYLDMCAGDHMSTTIDGDLPVCVSLREDDVVRLTNASPEFSAAEFSIAREMALFKSAPWEGSQCKDLEDNWDNRTRIYPHHGHNRGDWMNFVRSSFLRVAWELPGVKLRGVDITVGESGIPLRGGTSSSSALVVLSFLALFIANSDRLPAWDVTFICRLLGEAEWYVGTHGGANDQTTILRNLPNCVLYNRHSQPEIDSTILPGLKGVRMIVANSLWEANKTLGANHIFNLRKGWMDLGDHLTKLIIDTVTGYLNSETDLRSGWLGKLISERLGYELDSAPSLLESDTSLWQAIALRYRQFGSLDTSLLGVPDPAIDELVALLPAEISVGHAAQVLGKDRSAMDRDYTLPYMNEGGYRPRSAALFFVKENRIGRELEELLTEAETRLVSGDITVDSPDYARYQIRLGTILNDLQTTIRDDFHVSNYQLDLLLDIAQRGPGYLGGKLTGAGGGGCVVILVREGTETAFCEYLDSEYYHKPANFSVYRNKIAELPSDVSESLRANLDSALADIEAQRGVVTFSRGAGVVEV